jgi:hypothetical protein
MTGAKTKLDPLIKLISPTKQHRLPRDSENYTLAFQATSPPSE